MFKIITAEQGSPEWRMARLGRITAGEFDKVLTSTKKVSAQIKSVVHRMVAERLTGEIQSNEFMSSSMQRGVELESEAREFAKLALDIDFDQVGFLLHEEGYGCSPDGINLELKIGLELKCPEPKTHIGYLLDSDELKKKYWHQVQGSMLVTGFSQWYLVSYCPQLKPVILLIERDNDYLDALRDELIELNLNVLEFCEQLRN